MSSGASNGSSQPPPYGNSSGSSASGGANPLVYPTYSGHYYDYGIASFANATSTDMYATITLPWSGPRPGDYYHNLMSVFDSAGNYLQLGFISNWQIPVPYSYYVGPLYVSGLPQSFSDDWSVEWFFSTGCGTNYALGTNWGPDVFDLNAGGTYAFELKLTGHNNLEYLVHDFSVGGTTVWSLNMTDHASHFENGAYYWCPGSGPKPSYTFLEEPYLLAVGGFPSWNFNWTEITYNSTLATSWANTAVPASSYSVPANWHGGYFGVSRLGQPWDEITNNAFNPLYGTGGYLHLPNLGSHWVNSAGESAEGGYCRGVSTPCYMVWGGMSSGWSIAISNGCSRPLSQLPCGSGFMNFTIPSSASSGWNYIGGWWGYSQTPGGPRYEWCPQVWYVYI
jgi:hypothetical protein